MKNLQVSQHSNTTRVDHPTAFLFLSKGQTSARNTLDGALDKETNAVIISGPLGSGKTTLLDRFIQCLGNEINTAKVTASKYSSESILLDVLKAFNQDPPESGSKNTLNTLINFLQKQKSAQKTSVLIVDDADLLSHEPLESLFSLLEFGPNRENLVKLVLAGKTNPLQNLHKVGAPSPIFNKIRFAQIAPLSEEETDDYLKRLHKNPSNYRESVFSKSSSHLIHQYCKGNPLAINQLSRWALRFAYQHKQTSVTLSFVKMALNTSAWVRFSEQFPAIHGDKPASPRQARVGQPPKVRLFQKNEQIGVYDLGKNPVSLGRSPDNTIVLGHPTISRHHAQINTANNQTWIKNLSHSKHVYVNTQPVQHQLLNDGDIIRIDDFLLLFTLENAALTCSQELMSSGSSKQAKPNKPDNKNDRPNIQTRATNKKAVATKLPKEKQPQNHSQKPGRRRVIMVAGGCLLLAGIIQSLIFITQNNNTQSADAPQLPEASAYSTATGSTQPKPAIKSEKYAISSATSSIEGETSDTKTTNYTVDTFYGGSLFKTETINFNPPLDSIEDNRKPNN